MCGVYCERGVLIKILIIMNKQIEIERERKNNIFFHSFAYDVMYARKRKNNEQKIKVNLFHQNCLFCSSSSLLTNTIRISGEEVARK